jgi:hypothetical protein
MESEGRQVFLTLSLILLGLRLTWAFLRKGRFWKFPQLEFFM